MAILSSGDLSFEFCYSDYDADWVQYQFFFRWRNQNIIDKNILKQRGEYWTNRRNDALLANEYECDGLLPLLRKVLATDEPDYWEPLEPDMAVAIYPDVFFPFMPSHWKVAYESDEAKAEQEARRSLKEEMGPLPDDLFTVLVQVDTYNFQSSDAYSGQGLVQHLIVNRAALEAFANDLEKEYGEFERRFQITQED